MTCHAAKNFILNAAAYEDYQDGRSRQTYNTYSNPYAQQAISAHTSPTLAAGVTRLLYHLSRIIRDDTEQMSHGPGFGIDRKRRRELMEKRIAMGHKPDDHEDMQMQGFSM